MNSLRLGKLDVCSTYRYVVKCHEGGVWQQATKWSLHWLASCSNNNTRRPITTLIGWERMSLSNPRPFPLNRLTTSSTSTFAVSLSLSLAMPFDGRNVHFLQRNVTQRADGPEMLDSHPLSWKRVLIWAGHEIRFCQRKKRRMSCRQRDTRPAGLWQTPFLHPRLLTYFSVRQVM